MSSAVVILETKGSEFRVALVDNIDALLGSWDDKLSRFAGNFGRIREAFDSSDVFMSYHLALNEAKRKASSKEFLDNGIVFLDFLKRTPYL